MRQDEENNIFSVKISVGAPPVFMPPLLNKTATPGHTSWVCLHSASVLLICWPLLTVDVYATSAAGSAAVFLQTVFLTLNMKVFNVIIYDTFIQF